MGKGTYLAATQLGIDTQAGWLFDELTDCGIDVDRVTLLVDLEPGSGSEAFTSIEVVSFGYVAAARLGMVSHLTRFGFRVISSAIDDNLKDERGARNITLAVKE